MKILVVDDNAQNLIEAFEVLTAAGHEVTLACCPGDLLATDLMDGHDGVITDVFMPYRSSEEHLCMNIEGTRLAGSPIFVERLNASRGDSRRVLELMFSAGAVHGADHSFGPEKTAEYPTGVLVSSLAQSNGIPVVFCSSERHHGQKIDWLEQGFFFGMACVIAEDKEKKNWLRAARAIEMERSRTPKI